MAPSNLPLTLLMLGGGAVVAWAGITNPADGIGAELKRVMAGTPTKVKGAPSVADLYPAYGPKSEAGPTPAGGSVAHVLAEAEAQLGKPYVWGGNGPGVFDCSGFTKWCYSRGADVELPRVSAMQALEGARVGGLGNAVAGDLIYYGNPAHHVGIYLGAGQMIHAPHPGARVRHEAVSVGQLGGVRRIVKAA